MIWYIAAVLLPSLAVIGYKRKSAQRKRAACQVVLQLLQRRPETNVNDQLRCVMRELHLSGGDFLLALNLTEINSVREQRLYLAVLDSVGSKEDILALTQARKFDSLVGRDLAKLLSRRLSLEAANDFYLKGAPYGIDVLRLLMPLLWRQYGAKSSLPVVLPTAGMDSEHLILAAKACAHAEDCVDDIRDLLGRLPLSNQLLFFSHYLEQMSRNTVEVSTVVRHLLEDHVPACVEWGVVETTDAQDCKRAVYCIETARALCSLNDDQEAWRAFICLLDSSAGYHHHLVQSNWPMFRKVLDAMKPTNGPLQMGPDWVGCFLKRGLNHENKSLVKTVVTGLSDLSDLRFDLHFFCDYFLPKARRLALQPSFSTCEDALRLLITNTISHLSADEMQRVLHSEGSTSRVFMEGLMGPTGPAQPLSVGFKEAACWAHRSLASRDVREAPGPSRSSLFSLVFECMFKLVRFYREWTAEASAEVMVMVAAIPPEIWKVVGPKLTANVNRWMSLGKLLETEKHDGQVVAGLCRLVPLRSTFFQRGECRKDVALWIDAHSIPPDCTESADVVIRILEMVSERSLLRAPTEESFILLVSIQQFLPWRKLTPLPEGLLQPITEFVKKAHKDPTLMAFIFCSLLLPRLQREEIPSEWVDSVLGMYSPLKARDVFSGFSFPDLVSALQTKLDRQNVDSFLEMPVPVNYKEYSDLLDMLHIRLQCWSDPDSLEVHLSNFAEHGPLVCTVILDCLHFLRYDLSVEQIVQLREDFLAVLEDIVSDCPAPSAYLQAGFRCLFSDHVAVVDSTEASTEFAHRVLSLGASHVGVARSLTFPLLSFFSLCDSVHDVGLALFVKILTFTEAHVTVSGRAISADTLDTFTSSPFFVRHSAWVYLDRLVDCKSKLDFVNDLAERLCDVLFRQLHALGRGARDIDCLETKAVDRDSAIELAHDNNAIPMPDSQEDRFRIRVLQSLLVLSRILLTNDASDAWTANVWALLRIPMLQNARNIVEMIACRLVALRPEALAEAFSDMTDVSSPGPVLGSYLLVAAYAVIHTSCPADIRGRLWRIIVPHATSNVAYVRASAQYAIMTAQSVDGFAEDIRTYLLASKDAQKMLRRTKPIFEKWKPLKCRLDALFIDRDSYDFELSLCLAKDLKAAVATELSSAFVGTPAPLPNVVSDIANFQRKAVVWDDDDDDHREAAYKCKTRYPLIVIASLVEKTPNLAGLCRTSEVLGASMLI
ncbi:MAG: uncharacterized protein KVP18_001963, partial [Porospora cf. gigantea A]|uniref:uncharacterized protein n=1 Tax=Porospora cf. gigantea A TaxID=2853593 RepID=UPI0035598725